MTEEKKIEHKNIYSALSAFQGELKPIEKNGTVDFKTKTGEVVNYKYTTLDKVMELIYPLLAKNGLSVRHELGENSVECILTHETTKKGEESVERAIRKIDGGIVETTNRPSYFANEIRSGKLLIDTKKGEMKDVGGQITYGRRYTLGLVLGIASEEDKDAELFDQASKNVADYAFRTAKGTLEIANGDKLDEQIVFLQKELKLAEELEAGKGTKAPSLGLKSEQYRELLKVAEDKKVGKNDTTVVPDEQKL